MQEYIKKRAANIQRRISDLLKGYGYTPSCVPGSGELIAVEEIILALVEHEAAVWHDAEHAGPADREIVYIVIESYSRCFQSIGYLDFVSGTWLIYQDLGGGFAPLAEHASVIRWREKPKYPGLEGK